MLPRTLSLGWLPAAASASLGPALSYSSSLMPARAGLKLAAAAYAYYSAPAVFAA